MPTLHFDRLVAPTAARAEPRRWMLVVAGIYGAGRNWAPLARRLVRERPDWGVIPVDLRQHGQSRGFPPPHTLGACADDLIGLVAELGLDVRAILGHSFGGKVSLIYAARAPHPPERVWVVDSTPEAREPGGSAWQMLGALRRRPGPFHDRRQAVAAIEDEGFPGPVAQWMSTNLEGDGDLLRWRIQADDMEALLRDYFRTDAWDIVEHPPADMEIHFLRATESSVLGPAARARIERASRHENGRVFLHDVEGGHWLNSDNPDDLHRLLLAQLPPGDSER